MIIHRKVAKDAKDFALNYLVLLCVLCDFAVRLMVLRIIQEFTASGRIAGYVTS
jgi:hypothetical protein